MGGGPAGTTCAWKLKQKGMECIILDKNSFPREKVCAGWITPKVMKDLKIDIEEYPHTLVTFSRFHIHIYGKNPKIKTKQYAIRRYEFDDWLLKRSHAKAYHHHAKNIARDNGTYIIDDAYRCKYLIGAGGTYCPVYRSLFADFNPRARKSYITAIEEEFVCHYKDTNCHLWFFENGLPGYSWYVPKGHGYVNVGIGGVFERLKRRNTNIKKQWERFKQKLEDLSLIDNHPFSPKGYNYYLRQNIQVAHRNNAYLIGDSAGLATKDLGEGIGPAVESAILAADSICHGSHFSFKSVTTYSLPGIVLAGLDF